MLCRSEEVQIEDLPCPKCKATSHDLRVKEEAVISQNVDDGHPYTVAGYLAATEETQHEDTIDATGEGAATEAAQNDQDTGDASAATDAAQNDQDMGDATAEGAATEAAQNDQDTGDAQHEPEADIEEVARASADGVDTNVRTAAMPRLVRAASFGFQIDAVPAWNTKDETLVCCDCDQPCTKFRVISKGCGVVRCNKCCYVHTKLHRSKGPGSVETLVELPKEERIAFFKASHQPLTQKEQKSLFDRSVRSLEVYSMREKVFEMGGQYLPLSVWGKQGYDTKIIADQSEPDDVMPHRMWGSVYRVPILYVGTRGTDGTKSSDAAHVHYRPQLKRLRISEGSGSTLSSASAPEAEPEAAHGEPEAAHGEQGASDANDDDSDDSTSSSTSSSSSSATKKLKKKKKRNKKTDSKKEARKAAKKEKKRIEKEKKEAKKEKERQMEKARAEREAIKNAEREAREAEKEKKKRDREIEAAQKKADQRGAAIATSSCKRIERSIASIQNTMRLPGSADVPDVQARPLSEILTKLMDLYREVQDVSSGRATAAGFTVPDMEKKLLDSAKRHQALFAAASKTYSGER